MADGVPKFLYGWEGGSGPAIGVFSANDAGHKCIWSAQWSVARGVAPGGGGVVNADWMLSLFDMSLAQTLAELQDVSEWIVYPFRGETIDRKATALVYIAHLEGGDAAEWLAAAKGYLNTIREYYQDYVAPFSLPNTIRGGLSRPSWPVAGYDEWPGDSFALRNP